MLERFVVEKLVSLDDDDIVELSLEIWLTFSEQQCLLEVCPDGLRGIRSNEIDLREGAKLRSK